MARDSLATFGVLGGSVQIYDILAAPASYNPLVMIALLGLLPVSVGLARARPRRTLSRHFGQPDVTVTITVGDLFKQSTHLVIGYTDTFDTDITDPRVIHPSSVQAQFQRRHYPDAAKLESALAAALAHIVPRPDIAKTHGNTNRYPISTVAVLTTGTHLAFCLAYATMGSDLVARATVNDIWRSLSALWDAVYAHAHREPVSIAVIGSDLAKVDSLDRASIIRLIILSFIARTRTGVVTRQLTIVIHPGDSEKVNMLDLAAFLATV
ncbi:macro domain-containing protein [Amycolatopsis thailandensis]|uniref:macro domain-containing protein n=1 Tax=Amycolatopsis thailandensis TaxID=589330 RepID=UPI0037B68740